MSSNAQRRRLFFEPLEARQLLAANLAEGVLTIEGTQKNDRIGVKLTDDGTLVVSVNSRRSRFHLEDVSQLRILGGHGNDVIVVDPGITLATWISAGKGNDRVQGGGGSDEIHGEAGNDRIDGGLGDDVLFAGDGNDRVDGGEGNDELSGGAGKDDLGGGLGDDHLDGGAGHDWLSGGAGDDELDGGEGNDHVSGDDGGRQPAGGRAGNDKVWGGDGDDVLDGGAGNDKLAGDDGNDHLQGGAGDDRLDGGAGDNRLDGGSGRNKEINGTPISTGDAELIAVFSGPNGATGQAVFRSEPRQGEAPLLTLSIQLQGFTPGASLPVVIDGILAANLRLDAQGNGTIGFISESANEDPNNLPFPAGLSLHAGSTISVGPFSATFNAA